MDFHSRGSFILYKDTYSRYDILSDIFRQICLNKSQMWIKSLWMLAFIDSDSGVVWCEPFHSARQTLHTWHNIFMLFIHHDSDDTHASEFMPDRNLVFWTSLMQ
jgi:hypothetical protein